jgi:hypothetical protein
MEGLGRIVEENCKHLTFDARDSMRFAGPTSFDRRVRQLFQHGPTLAQARGPSKADAIAPWILNLAHELATFNRHWTSVQLCPGCLKALKGFFELWEVPIDNGPARTG